MSRVRVNSFGISLDGYGAGPDQGLEHPLGRGGEELHRWFFPTRTFQRLYGKEDGHDRRRRGFRGARHGGARRLDLGAQHVRAGARALARRGWQRLVGRGAALSCARSSSSPTTNGRRWRWRAARSSTSSPAASRRRSTAPGRRRASRDIRVGGGAATIRQYLQAGLIDEMHVAIAPILLGGGESLFAGLDLPALGYEVAEHVPTEAATHVVLSKRAAPEPTSGADALAKRRPLPRYATRGIPEWSEARGATAPSGLGRANGLIRLSGWLNASVSRAFRRRGAECAEATAARAMPQRHAVRCGANSH